MSKLQFGSLMTWMRQFFLPSSSEDSKEFRWRHLSLPMPVGRLVNAHLPGGFPTWASLFFHFYYFLTITDLLSLLYVRGKHTSFLSSITSKLRRPSDPHHSDGITSEKDATAWINLYYDWYDNYDFSSIWALHVKLFNVKMILYWLQGKRTRRMIFLGPRRQSLKVWAHSYMNILRSYWPAYHSRKLEAVL